MDPRNSDRPSRARHETGAGDAGPDGAENAPRAPDQDPDAAARADHDLVRDAMTPAWAKRFLKKHGTRIHAATVEPWLKARRGLRGYLGRVWSALAVIVPVVAGLVAILEADIFEPLRARLSGETGRAEIEEGALPESETVAPPPAPPLAERDPPTFATDPAYLEDFETFLDDAGIGAFDAEDLLVLGAGNASLGRSCFGKNTLPPRPLWDNILPTARVLQELEARLEAEVRITNVYRSPEYNTCIGGAPNSTHTRFLAVDFRIDGAPIDAAAETLAVLRAEGWFRGGIGRYRSFIHLDTRGINSTWPADFAALIEGR